MEFRTRKAHRWVVREKDLLKYWTVMITCVLVYLTSGTISTLQHSKYSMLGWRTSDNNTNGSSDTSITNITNVTYVTNVTNVTPMQIFPKSGIHKSESGVAGTDGVRTHYSNSTFLLQKARFLSRQSDSNGVPTPQPVLVNDTDVNKDNFNVSTTDVHHVEEAPLKYGLSLSSIFVYSFKCSFLLLF